MSVKLFKVSGVRALALSICLTALPTLGQATEVRSSLTAADTKGKIHFKSGAVKTPYSKLMSGQVELADEIWGDLALPGSGLFGKVTATPEKKVAAMVIMHSSGGLTQHSYEWAKYFNDMGMATFVLSSFEPRGFKRTAENQSQITPAAVVSDALQALKLLSTHPLIDSKRIGIIGFSKGGRAGLLAGFEKFRSANIQGDLKYAAHIAFYGGCSEMAKTTGSPILMLVGSADEVVNSEKCEFNVEKLRETGANVKLVVYPGVQHGFDTTNKVKYLADMEVWNECVVANVNFDTGLHNLKGVAEPLTTKQLRQATEANHDACQNKRGGSAGGDYSARDAARKEVEAFVAKYL